MQNIGLGTSPEDLHWWVSMKLCSYPKFNFYPFFCSKEISDGEMLGSLLRVSIGSGKGFSLGTESESCKINFPLRSCGPWLGT